MTSPSRIDSVHAALHQYEGQLETHPIGDLCARAALPREILESFARAQLVDNTLWVPMLALAKDKLSAPLLREAVRRNIMDEVGADGISHVTLCKQFVESVGLPTHYEDYREFSPASVYPVQVMMGLTGRCDDLLMAGWLISQENLVPAFFRMFRPAFAAIEGADTGYLVEHEEVDSAEHAQWFLEAVAAMLNSDEDLDRVLTGIDMGGRATLAVPDYLYSQAVSMGVH